MPEFASTVSLELSACCFSAALALTLWRTRQESPKLHKIAG
jgi:hypothetical protein